MTITDDDIMNKAREVQSAAAEAELRSRLHEALPPEYVETVPALFDDVSSRFERFVGHDAAAVEPVLESVRATRSAVSDGAGTLLQDVDADVAEWHSPPGGAADNFKQNFLGRMPMVQNAQAALLCELEAGLQAACDIALESRKNLVDIGDKTVKALHALGTGDGPAPVQLTVLHVTASAPTGFESDLQFALAGGAAHLTATVDAEAAVIEGDDAFAVVESMHAAVTRLENAVFAKDAALAKALIDDIQIADSARVSHLEPIRPTVIDDPEDRLDQAPPPPA